MLHSTPSSTPSNQGQPFGTWRPAEKHWQRSFEERLSNTRIKDGLRCRMLALAKICDRHIPDCSPLFLQWLGLLPDILTESRRPAAFLDHLVQWIERAKNPDQVVLTIMHSLRIFRDSFREGFSFWPLDRPQLSKDLLACLEAQKPFHGVDLYLHLRRSLPIKMPPDLLATFRSGIEAHRAWHNGCQPREYVWNLVAAESSVRELYELCRYKNGISKQALELIGSLVAKGVSALRISVEEIRDLRPLARRIAYLERLSVVSAEQADLVRRMASNCGVAAMSLPLRCFAFTEAQAKAFRALAPARCHNAQQLTDIADLAAHSPAVECFTREERPALVERFLCYRQRLRQNGLSDDRAEQHASRLCLMGQLASTPELESQLLEIFGVCGGDLSLPAAVVAIRNWLGTSLESKDAIRHKLAILGKLGSKPWEDFGTTFLRVINWNYDNELAVLDLSYSEMRKRIYQQILDAGTSGDFLTLTGMSEVTDKVIGELKIAIREFRFLRSHQYFLAFIREADIAQANRIGQMIGRLINIDGGPWKEGSPEQRRAFGESLEISRRGFSLHTGFGAQTFEARRAPFQKLNLLARFGLECGIQVHQLDPTAAEKVTFPGPGVLLAGFRLDNIFAHDPSRPADPWHVYKEAWDWAAQEIEDLADSQILSMRGLFGVVGPNNTRYRLDGVSYSLVVYNDHFHNPSNAGFYLVPSHFLMEPVLATFARIDTRDSKSRQPYFRLQDLSITALQARAKAERLNILNLGWASNINSLGNAYPVGSAPYFRWENDPELKHHTRDLFGHIHKSHRLGRFQYEMTPELDAAMAEHRQAHNTVYQLATRLLNLHDLYRLGRALWHQDRTGTTTEEPQFAKDELSLSVSSPRMLVEAYKWHGRHKLGTTSTKNDFPVLCVAATLDYSSVPQSAVWLDTFDMRLYFDSGSIELPRGSDGSGELELEIWNRFFRPQLSSGAGVDLRFMHRADLKDNFPGNL